MCPESTYTLLLHDTLFNESDKIDCKCIIRMCDSYHKIGKPDVTFLTP